MAATDIVPDRDGLIGRITDDTQMTLFRAEGWLRGYTRIRDKGISGAETALVLQAYQRWLDTQDHDAPPPEMSEDHRYGRLRQEPWL